jgi:hypothetical protein
VRDYIDSGEIPLYAWVSFAAVEKGLIDVNGEFTSNRAEQEMSLSRMDKCKARHVEPLQCFIGATKQHARLMGKFKDSAKNFENKGNKLLPDAATLYESLLKRAATSYEANFDGGSSHVTVQYNGMEQYTRVVDLDAIPLVKCNCNERPCHHMIVAIRTLLSSTELKAKFPAVSTWARLALFEHLFDQQDFVSEYSLAYASVPPITRPSLYSLVPCSTTIAPPVLKTRGRKSAPKRKKGCEESGGRSNKVKRQKPSGSTCHDYSLLPSVSNEMKVNIRALLSIQMQHNAGAKKVIAKTSEGLNKALEVMKLLTDSNEQLGGLDMLDSACEAIRALTSSLDQVRICAAAAVATLEHVDRYIVDVKKSHEIVNTAETIGHVSIDDHENLAEEEEEEEEETSDTSTAFSYLDSEDLDFEEDDKETADDFKVTDGDEYSDLSLLESYALGEQQLP